MPLFSDIAALLRAPVGNNLDNRPEDVENLKRNFAREGRYKKPVENGYHDQELEDSIFSFQRENKLKVDGRMNPGGETEAALVGKLLNLPTQEATEKEVKPGVQQVSALPSMALRLFGFGLGTAGAMEWWKNNSTDHRNDIVGAIKRDMSGERDKDESARCDEMYYNLTKACDQVKKQYGAEAGAICRKQASEIYAACRAGKPKDQWPPFSY